MTVQDTPNIISYVGNGIQTVFNFTFRVDDVSWLNIDFMDDFDQFNLNVDQDNNPGGNATYLVAPPALQTLTMVRSTPQTQELDYTRYDPFDSEATENNLDKIVMMIQDLEQALSGITGTILPGTVNDSMLRWDLGQQEWVEETRLRLSDTGVVTMFDSLLGDNVTLAVEALTLAPAPGVIFTASANVEVYGFDKSINIDGGDLHFSSDTARLAFYRYGDAISSHIKSGSGNSNIEYVAVVGDHIFTGQLQIPTYRLPVTTAVIAANSVTLNQAAANVFIVDVDDATLDFAVVLTNPPVAGQYGEITIRFIQGAPAFDAVWPASVTWPGGGTAPVLSTADDAIDVVHLWTDDGGVTYQGSFLQDYS